MCNEAVQAVLELEHMGLPLTAPEGRISQRQFGGHTNNVTGKPVRRACHAADRTGPHDFADALPAMFEDKVNFYDEYQVLDLLIVDGKAAGAVAVELATGELHTSTPNRHHGNGCYGRIWEITYQRLRLHWRRGRRLPWRNGIPLEDVEFFQIHPTGIYKLGILITEGVRGEGGILINGKGERFMEKNAPHVQDLASRDCGQPRHCARNPCGNGN